MNHRPSMPLLLSLGKDLGGVCSYKDGAPTELVKSVHGADSFKRRVSQKRPWCVRRSTDNIVLLVVCQLTGSCGMLLM